MTPFQTRMSQEFCFLVKEFGFEMLLVRDLLVKFQRGSLSISVSYNSFTHELWLEIFNGERSIDINQIMAFVNNEEGNKSYLFQGSLEDVINVGVCLLANKCREVVIPIIQNPILFDEVIINSKKMLSSSLVSDKKKLAEKAFKEGRFQDVIEIYADIKDQLTETDMQRLKIARRR